MAESVTMGTGTFLRFARAAAVAFWFTVAISPAVAQLGAEMVVDLTSGSASTSIADLAATGDFVYFIAQSRVWKSDATAALDRRLFFIADDGEHGTELWRTLPENSVREWDGYR
jgi:hypothetical protein